MKSNLLVAIFMAGVILIVMGNMSNPRQFNFDRKFEAKAIHLPSLSLFSSAHAATKYPRGFEHQPAIQPSIKHLCDRMELPGIVRPVNFTMPSDDDLASYQKTISLLLKVIHEQQDEIKFIQRTYNDAYLEHLATCVT